MIKRDFFHFVNLKNVRCLSYFCWAPNRGQVKELSKLTFFTLKTWKIYDVSHIFGECRIEYEIKNARIKVYYFHSKNLKNLQCMLHFCCLPNRVRDREWRKLTISLRKPKKCAMYVTLLLRGVEYEIKNDQSCFFFHSVNLKNLRCMSHFCRVPNRVWDKEWSHLTIFTFKTWKMYTIFVTFLFRAE